MSRALITGITGQDGTYLAELLLAQGYDVTGTVHAGDPLRGACEDLLPGVVLVEADLQDGTSLLRAVEAAQPDEVYNLAAFSAPGASWQQPELTVDVTGVGVLRLLEALRTHGLEGVRLCQASSSEVFGRSTGTALTEDAPMRPRSPYGSAKALAHAMVTNYREAYGAFLSNAVLFNHESPRRGPQFVTRKITRAAAAISLGLETEVRLGNLDVRRDWGHARDYVRAMSLVLQADEPGDFVVASGRSHSLADLLTLAFAHVGIDDWTPHVVQDPALVRPVEADVLVGDATKARTVLGWEPEVGFEQLVAEMVEHDLSLLGR